MAFMELALRSASAKRRRHVGISEGQPAPLEGAIAPGASRRDPQAVEQEASRMPRSEEKIPGPIEGLRLPQRAWAMLRRENITTIDRLRAVADRLQRFEGVGFRTALAIREEIARAKPRWPG
jgi:DNA-directed RNA polymerase alpha subunit